MHRILIVDDEQFMLNSLKRILEQEDYMVITASNGEEAMSVVTTTDVDVIISDESMPGISGSNLISLINRLFPSIVSIILTGNPTIESMTYAVNEGNAFKYLSKPIYSKDILENVAKAVQLRKALKNTPQTAHSPEQIICPVTNPMVQDTISAKEFVSSLPEEKLAHTDKLLELTNQMFVEINKMELTCLCNNLENIEKLAGEIASILAELENFTPVIEALRLFQTEVRFITDNYSIEHIHNLLPLLYLIEEQLSEWAVNIFVHQNAGDINYISGDLRQMASQIKISSFE